MVVFHDYEQFIGELERWHDQVADGIVRMNGVYKSGSFTPPLWEWEIRLTAVVRGQVLTCTEKLGTVTRGVNLGDDSPQQKHAAGIKSALEMVADKWGWEIRPGEFHEPTSNGTRGGNHP